MASKYYDSSGKDVADGNVAYADDLNQINQGVDSGFDQVESDIDDALGQGEYWATQSKSYAVGPEDPPDPDVEVEPGLYAAKKYATDSEVSSQDSLGYSQDSSSEADRAEIAAQDAEDQVVLAADQVVLAEEQVGLCEDQVVLATAQVALATAQVGLATDEADRATEEANRAESIVDLCQQWEIVATDYTASSGDALLIDTTLGEIEVTLPASPTTNQCVFFADYAKTFDGNRLLVVSTEDIQGVSENMEVTSKGVSFGLTYDATKGWVIV